MKSAKRKREDCFQRTEQAIKLLIKENKEINFNIVSQTAKVTLGWLYKQPELVERIRSLMKQQEKAVELPQLQRPSSASQSQLLDNLKQRIREQDSEIKQLKKQLAVWGGLIRQQAETIEQLNGRLGEKT
ncbi:hypothetical protein WA1_51425 [Scytonema hofmannii PCC 7110]|uniref:Transposase n=1 Tax=Scytonema hofmannii PCC 7110 TaxID=128403 RepID=A0A139WQA1_9CYAN|nr:hypothetical protein WA1_51425 [Scytonema hofmannii PCC 7110]